ncbi:MAG: cysteine desulfurase-like protein [Anaerolineales bacterium]
MTFDPNSIRGAFPSLKSSAVYMDNPGGTQVPTQVIDRMTEYLHRTNANHGGAFDTSQKSDEVIDEARLAVAQFLNAPSPDEIVFGPNMTSLTFSVSRALARTLNPSDEIILTRLDHDANISPWLLVAEERGCKVHWVDFDVEDCTLRMDQLRDTLSERTKIVAVGYASNAVGTINPVAEIVELAHQVGAICYVDAVQYAPHGPIDVQELDADFLVVSAYKFFGPHVGALYGKRDILEDLQAYKVRPAPETAPGKFETGTQNFEGIAGTLGSLEYLSEIGTRMMEETSGTVSSQEFGRRTALNRAMEAIQSYEMQLSRALIKTLSSIPGLRIWGIVDENSIAQRVPTVSFTMEGYSPRQIATELNKADIYAWDGNYYALAVTDRLGLEGSGGMLRVGLVHYNTLEEIDRLGEALSTLI